MGARVFSSPLELWKTIEGNEENLWYNAATRYWDSQEASYNGVLGGHGHVSEADVVESEKFLCRVITKRPDLKSANCEELVAVDCGAGVGRVTEQLLVRYFDIIDLVEPSKHLLEAAEQRLKRRKTCSSSVYPRGTVGKTFCLGLQSFQPEKCRYDVIWIQWALLYLTDVDAIAFFRRCIAALKLHGVIFVKENICPSDQNFVVDEVQEDKSLTRSHKYMMKLFSEANLQVLCSAKQQDFPAGLFRVQMYAICPSAST